MERKFKVGDRCKVVESMHHIFVGQIVIIDSVQHGYYYAHCIHARYPFVEKELKLHPLTKLEKAMK